MKAGWLKRMACGLLALLMTTTVLPVSAFAETETIPSGILTLGEPVVENTETLTVDLGEGAQAVFEVPEENLEGLEFRQDDLPEDDPDEAPDREDSVWDVVRDERDEPDFDLLSAELHCVLSGSVVDEKGVGIPGVNVSFYDLNLEMIVGDCYTDEQGSWTFSGAIVQNSAYHLRFHSPYHAFDVAGLQCVAQNDAMTLAPVTGKQVFEPQEAAEESLFTTETVDGFNVAITGYLGDRAVVAIPEFIDGKNVQVIAADAFRDNTGLTAVILPKGLTTVENSAFYGCSALEYVGFNDELTVIEGSAFSGCSSLTGVDLPNSLAEIKNHAFYNCVALEDVVMSMSLRGIYGYAFAGCTALETITIPNSVAGLGYRAFYNCTALGTVLLPTQWQSSLGYYVTPNTHYGRLFEGCTALKSLIVPESMVTLPDHAFDGCTLLEEVSLPKSLKTIGQWAFRNCDSLTAITIPGNVKTISESAFEYCDSLATIDLQDGVKEIWHFAFRGLPALEALVLPDSVESMGYQAFAENANLASVQLSAGWETSLVDPGAADRYGHTFSQCPKLTEITIPEGMTVIPAHAFEGCTHLQQVTLHGAVKEIGESAFRGCSGLTGVELPNGLEKIGESAFENNTGLTAIAIPGSCTHVGVRAFQGCTKLEELELESGIKTLESYAFAGCSALTAVVMPDSVQELGYRLFADCTNLSQVTMSAGWTTNLRYWLTPNYHYGSLFAGCGKLTEIAVTGNVLPAHAFEGCSSLQVIRLPDGLTAIPDSAFRGCSALKELAIPAGVASIGTWAFSGANSLQTIRLPGGVSSVGDSAFRACTGLTALELNNGLETIGEYAISDCPALTELTLPNTVTTIGAYAFQGNERLEKVTMSASWGRGGGDLLKNCPNLRELIIPEGVVNIPEYAFKNTSGLRRLVLPDSLEAIRGHAFYGCADLRAIWIPAGALAIGNQWVFYGCDNLTIHGVAGSYAETYAQANNIPFSTEPVMGGGEAAALAGKVYAPDGTPLAGVAVQIYDATDLEDYANLTTDASGAWNAKDLPDDHDWQVRYFHKLYDFEGIVRINGLCESKALTTTALSAFTPAAETPGTDFTWKVTDGNNVQITGYTGTAADLVIPAGIEGYVVDSIGEGVFKNNDTLQTVVLPDSLRTIGKQAFHLCYNLREIRFGNDLQTIGESAFDACFALKKLVAPNSLQKIDHYAFVNCTSLETVSLPDKLESTGLRLFQNNTALTACNIPLGWKECIMKAWPVEKQGAMFEGCPAMTAVTVPEGMKALPEGAFWNCTYLQSIQLPASLKTIGKQALQHCTSLTALDLPAGLETIEEQGVNNTGITALHIPAGMRTIGLYGCAGNKNLAQLTFDEGLEVLGHNAFEGCVVLTALDLPDTLRSMGYQSFKDCTALSQVTLSSGWTECPQKPYPVERSGAIFQGCTSLLSITVPQEMTTLPEHAFRDCHELEEIILPAGLTVLPQRALAWCTSLKSLTLPVGLQRIEERALEGCSSLKTLTIPDTVTYLGVRALASCTGLQEVSLSQGLEVMDSYALESCTGLLQVEVPHSVTTMGFKVFNNCSHLQSVSLSPNWTESTTYWDGSNRRFGSIFSDCSALTRVEVPQGAALLPGDAFRGNPYLRTVILPESLAEIGAGALRDCANLEVVWVDRSTVRYGEQAFSGCPKLAIHGYAGTAAQTYANENKIPFVAGPLDNYFVGLSGRVANEKGGYLSGVSVSIVRASDQSAVAQLTTDANGEWVFAEAEKGETYAVRYYSPYHTFDQSRMEVLMEGTSTVLPQVTAIQDREENPAAPGTDFTWTVTSGQFIQITGYTGSDTDLVIPAVIDGYTVESIADVVFKNNKTLTSVVFPDTLRVIGEETFRGCTGLTYIGFGGVETIGGRAFQDCTGLTRLVLSNSLVSAGHYAFANCTGLTTVSLPDGLAETGYKLFADCAALTQVNIPLGWKTCLEDRGANSYHGNTFAGCTGLTKLTLPEGMAELPDYAFQNCGQLTELTLPSTLKTIGYRALQSCAGLTELILPEAFETFEGDAVRFSGLTAIHFPASMRTIGDNAFQECRSLARVTFEEGLLTIGHNAFEGCVLLTELHLPRSVESLGFRAFASNPELAAATLPANWKDCPQPSHYDWQHSFLFADCPKLKRVVLPEGMAMLPDHAFRGCAYLEEIVLSDGIPAIGDEAFRDCIALKTLVIPDSVESIGKGAFANCKGLTRLTLPAGVHTVGEYAFENCTGLKDIDLSVDLEVIGKEAFGGCTGLTQVVLPSKVWKLGERTFRDCTQLTSVTLSAALQNCGNGEIFAGCISLNRLDVPEGVSTIPNNAFKGTGSLVTVSLPQSLRTIGDYAFQNCENLTGVELGGVLTIGKYAFQNCKNLKNMILSDDLRKVGDYVFAGCSMLWFEDLPPRMTSIGKHAFNGLQLLQLNIPVGVTTLSDSCFANNARLGNVTIRQNVTVIHDNAFQNCPDLFIYCYEGSAAHNYAQKFNIPCEAWPVPVSFSGSDLDNATYVPFQGTDANGEAITLNVSFREYGTLKELTVDPELFHYENGHLKVTKDGYYRIDIPDCTLLVGNKLNLALVPEDSDTYVSAVHCAGKDALANQASIDDDTEEMIVRVYSTYDVKEYELLQDGGVLAKNSTGEFKLDPKLVVKDKPISVKMTLKWGYETKRLATNIAVAEEATPWGDRTLSIGEKASFGVPSDVPVIGGGKFEIDFNVLPFYWVREGNVFRAGVGCKMDLLKNEMEFLNFKKFIETQDENIQNGLTLLEQAKGGLHAGKGSPELDLEIYGFVEGVFNSQGLLDDVSGNIMVKVTAGYKYAYQTIVYVVPVVLKAEFSASVEAMTGLGFDVVNAKFYMNGRFAVTLPEITLSAGVGVAYIADVSVYGSAKNELVITRKAGNRLTTATLSGEMGVSATVLFKTYKKPLLKDDWIYYHSGASAALLEEPLLALTNPTAHDFETDRSYLPRQTGWMGDSVDLLAVGQSQDLQKSVFYSAQPQLVQTENGKRMLIWTGDDPKRSTGNHTAIMYSVYDDAAGSWSPPALVEDDGTADFQARAVAAGDSIYLVWMDSSSDHLTADATLEELAAANGISAAVYKDGSWTVQSLAGVSAAMLPQIAMIGETPYIVWAENSACDLLNLSGTNTIRYAAYNGSWTPGTCAAVDKPVLSLDIGSLGGQAAIAYTTDADGDLKTTADIELYAGSLTGADKVTDNAVPEQHPIFTTLNGAQVLAWYADGSLCTMGSAGGSATTYTGDISPDFRLVEWNGQNMVLYAEGQKANSRLQAATITGTAIGSPVTLYSNDHFISAYEVLLDGQTLYIPYTSVYANITDKDIHETTDLCLLTVEPFYDLRVDKISADTDNARAGQTLPVEITVTNTGTLPVTEVYVRGSLSGGSKLSVDKEVPLAVGETATITVGLKLEQTIEPGSIYTFEVKNNAGSAWQSANNTGTLMVGYADLQLRAESLRSVDSEKVLLTVENVGNVATAASLRVRQGNAQGQVLGVYRLADLAPDSIATVQLDSEKLSAMGTGEQTLFFEAFAVADEQFFSNNTAFVHLLGANPTMTVKTVINGAPAAQITEITGSCTVTAAVYDEAGRMLAVRTADRTAVQAEVEIDLTVESLPADYQVMLFITNSAYAPVHEAIKVK